MPTATSGWPCYAATAAGRLRPGLSPTAALASPKFVALSVGSYIYLFITEKNLTEFVSFILTQCGINIKRKVVLLLDLLFSHYFVLIKYEKYFR